MNPREIPKVFWDGLAAGILVCCAAILLIGIYSSAGWTGIVTTFLFVLGLIALVWAVIRVLDMIGW